VFDWSLLKNVNAGVPFMLSGGLDSDNAAEALRVTRAPGLDVSSGVERSPGEKDPEKIRAFIRAARAAEAEVFSPPLQPGEASIVRPVK
jgi:phosphoribosylanthranilate isomerase